MELHIVHEQSKEVGRGQDSIQSSTTHDLGHGMVWEGDKTQENIIYKGAKRSALSLQVTARLQEIDMMAIHIKFCLVPGQAKEEPS